MQNMKNNLLGYDSASRANIKHIFIGSTLMSILGFILAYLDTQNQLSFKYILSHILDVNYFFNTIIDSFSFLYGSDFEKKWSFSFMLEWSFYSFILNFIFLFIFIYYQNKKSQNWMYRIYLSDSFYIAFMSALIFIGIAYILIYLILYNLTHWIFDIDKMILAKLMLTAHPLILALATVGAYNEAEDKAYTNSVQFKIYPILKEKMYISNLEQVPNGYGFEPLGMVEANSVNNRDLADAYLLLKAYQMGANGIIKYQLNHTTNTHGNISTDMNYNVSGKIKTDNHFRAMATAIKMFKL